MASAADLFVDFKASTDWRVVVGGEEAWIGPFDPGGEEGVAGGGGVFGGEDGGGGAGQGVFEGTECQVGHFCLYFLVKLGSST